MIAKKTFYPIRLTTGYPSSDSWLNKFRIRTITSSHVLQSNASSTMEHPKLREPLRERAVRRKPLQSESALRLK